jgi:CRISPR system Cascade subunit CasE
MIASVLRLSRSDCKALRVTDPYSIHRVVYSLFPKKEG